MGIDITIHFRSPSSWSASSVLYVLIYNYLYPLVCIYIYNYLTTFSIADDVRSVDTGPGPRVLFLFIHIYVGPSSPGCLSSALPSNCTQYVRNVNVILD